MMPSFYKASITEAVRPVVLLLLILCTLPACRSGGNLTQRETVSVPAAQSAQKTESSGSHTVKIRTDTGFRTRRNLDEHYEKHGSEFGSITKAEYLRQAQQLRDAPAGGDILEARRNDGVTTRFDRRTGTFLAFNEDLTIRTCFRPNDGEAYFRRQLKKSH
jgi:hypothetical protein